MDKARPGRDADHSSPSSAEVMKEYELYLLSPKSAPVEHNRTTLPSPFTFYHAMNIFSLKNIS
jgi:hypothetical protein